MDTRDLPVVRRELYVPPLSEIVQALSSGLTSDFQDVTVEEVDCPDLTQQPFTLARAGLNGKPHIFDIGGPPFLLPTPMKDKVYDLPEISKLAGIEPMLVIGAGAGPWPHLGANCEGIYNMGITNGIPDQQSRIASITPIGADKENGVCKLERLPFRENRCALLVNILVSQGLSGKVVKVNCKKRIGNDDFIASIRRCLFEKFGERCVGLGGTFLLKEGRSKQHVMPDFSKVPLDTEDDLNNWLHFFDMKAPLINVGTVVSFDPGLDLRVQHFHTFSHHGEGGHYHIDTTPDSVEYLGYFTVAETLVRVDQPTVTHSLGRD